MHRPNGRNEVTTVLLDLDGTLVDSNDQHTKAWVEVLAEYGHEVPFKLVRAAIGKGADKLLPDLVGVKPDSREGKAITARRSTLFREKYLSTLRAFPGAPELLQRLHADGLHLVVATSSTEEQMKTLVSIAGGDALMYDAASAADGKRSKPDADIVESALRRAGCTAGEAVMLGDTPYDVEAARGAHVECVAFRCGGWGDHDLRGAAGIYDGPADLLANLEASPLKRRL